MAAGATSDLSLKTLTILTLGLLLWLAYATLKHDWAIIASIGVGAALSASVLAFKIRDVWSSKGSVGSGTDSIALPKPAD